MYIIYLNKYKSILKLFLWRRGNALLGKWQELVERFLWKLIQNQIAEWTSVDFGLFDSGNFLKLTLTGRAMLLF
jgi:hypothetical protein